MLTLVEVEQIDSNTVATRYDCDVIVECDGSSIWGDTAGHSVRVTHIDVIDITYDDGYTTRMVNVTHNSDMEIYTDNGFEVAVSKLLGFDVVFTEEGMQDVGYASMEA
jgi:hypothetical protein